MIEKASNIIPRGVNRKLTPPRKSSPPVIVVAFTIATIAKGTIAPANDSNAGQTNRVSKNHRIDESVS
jgi:hypothetical protein